MTEKHKFKITLFALNSSYIHTNPAVRAIRAALGTDFDAVILEKSLKDPRGKTLHELYAENSDIYGFSAYIWNITELLSFASSLKQLLPNCKIVFGGPEVSYETDEFFERYPFIDYVIRGEGESAFRKLCFDIEDNKFVPRPAFIDGGHYENFAQSGILYDRYPAASRPMLYYESSRGCPFGCSYCLSSADCGVRCKSSETVLDELLEFEKDEVRGDKPIIIKFIDRTFNFDRKRARTIWRELSEKKYTNMYHFEVCAELLEAEDFELLDEVPDGKFLFEVGIQSTYPKTLAAINRSSDVAALLKNLARLKKRGNLHLHTDLIAGLPYESFERFGQSFDETYPLSDVLQLGFLKLLKGTAIRRDCDLYGYKFSDAPPYEILSNDFISYDELFRLHEIAAVTEKFSGDGTFSRSTAFLLSSARDMGLTPFSFFGRLADFIPNPNDCGQRILFRRFADFAGTLLNGDLLTPFTERLAFDFLLSENGRPPEFLRLDQPDLSDYKNSYFESLKSSADGLYDESRRKIFSPSVEAYIFGFNKDNVYLIDRKNHSFTTVSRQM